MKRSLIKMRRKVDIMKDSRVTSSVQKLLKPLGVRGQDKQSVSKSRKLFSQIYSMYQYSQNTQNHNKKWTTKTTSWFNHFNGGP